jgi:hypothetical protein
MNLTRTLLGLLLCLLALTTHAQWQWLDKDGRRVFSDLPPPSDVPAKNIVRKPGAMQQPGAVAASATASSPSALTGAGVDKTLMERKKQAEEAQAAKTRAEEQRFAQAQADSCARARSALAGLDAGLRISRTNANGEREFLEGASREAESMRLQRIVDADCK